MKGEDETANCDVLVIGMGASGSVAALSAAEQGAKVIGIDSSAMLGGMGNAAQGMFAIGTSLQQERYGTGLGFALTSGRLAGANAAAAIAE